MSLPGGTSAPAWSDELFLTMSDKTALETRKQGRGRAKI